MPVIRFKDDVLVDVVSMPGQTFATAGSQGIPDVEKKFKDTLESLTPILKTLSASADEVILEGKAMEVEFKIGVSLNAEGNFLIGKLGTEATIEITTKFKREQK